MTSLSVNVNKIATLRNARGGNTPNVLESALKIQKFGADGITVHPRPDERHIRYSDVFDLKKSISVELNIEGNPKEDRFVELVLNTKPHQVTLVPDTLGQLTSDHGWDTIKERKFLIDIIELFSKQNIRTSIFVDPIEKIIQGAAETGTDRIELYTETYAQNFTKDKNKAIKPFVEASKVANDLKLGINAGHDLNLNNLNFFNQKIVNLKEVSIGHALISDALDYGLENTINLYKRSLRKF
ncbi:MAG: pyridoxine 5'-phosphate synthase [Crocinitomicaceae bacterium]|nr:pyridoxine 5'-phosphate synthase [Crocinitomicaceae bacterium]|tara:strand:- start:9553 stop:10275 length:723 start_codon:yes stop_codon:yes gene_type:complete